MIDREPSESDGPESKDDHQINMKNVIKTNMLVRSKSVTFCVIFVLACVAFNCDLIRCDEIELKKSLPAATISRAMFESRTTGGLRGCIEFGVKLAHEIAKLDQNLDESSKLFTTSDDIVRSINPILNALLGQLENSKFNLRDSVIKYTKKCQTMFGWEYLIGNSNLFRELKADEIIASSGLSKDVDGSELAKMKSLKDLLPPNQ